MREKVLEIARKRKSELTDDDIKFVQENWEEIRDLFIEAWERIKKQTRSC